MSKTGAVGWESNASVSLPQLEQFPNATTAHRIDATDLVVSPGFIDLQGQSEFNLLVDGRAASKVTQGVEEFCAENCRMRLVILSQASTPEQAHDRLQTECDMSGKESTAIPIRFASVVAASRTRVIDSVVAVSAPMIATVVAEQLRKYRVEGMGKLSPDLPS